MVILVLDIAQLLIFLILSRTDFGNNSRKPASNMYVWISGIVNILVVVGILIVFFLIGDIAGAAPIMANLIIPILVSVNIIVFAAIFYGFTKASK